MQQLRVRSRRYLQCANVAVVVNNASIERSSITNTHNAADFNFIARVIVTHTHTQVTAAVWSDQGGGWTIWSHCASTRRQHLLGIVPIQCCTRSQWLAVVGIRLAPASSVSFLSSCRVVLCADTEASTNRAALLNYRTEPSRHGSAAHVNDDNDGNEAMMNDDDRYNNAFERTAGRSTALR